jgi:hypothetical protein
MSINMKNYFLAALLFFPFLSFSDNNHIKNSGYNSMQVEDVFSDPEDLIQLEVMVDNTDEFVAFSFDLVFPENIMTYNPDPGFTFLSDRATDHSLFVTLIEPGLLRVFAFSFTNSTFSGNSGSIVSLGFFVNAPHEGAEYPLILVEPILANLVEDILDESFDGTLYVVIDEAEIPDILPIDNIELADGEDSCFNATQSIITAGEDAHFIVQPGANATLIAGENIKMLPGTHIHEGANLHAYIAPDGPFCGEPEKHFLAVAEDNRAESKNTEITNVSEIETPADRSFTVFPNPATDYFTVELYRFEPDAKITVEVYSTQGRLILQKQLQSGPEHVFSLEGQHPGIYLVRLIQDEFIGVQRLIKR